MKVEYFFVIYLCFLKNISCDVTTSENQPVVPKSDNHLFQKSQTERTFTDRNSTITNFEELEKDDIRDELFEAPRKHQDGGKHKDEKGFMEKILPMMVTPFIVSTSMIPMMLVSMFVMLVKSAFMGKLGIGLLLFSMLRQRNNNQGGVYSHNINMNKNEDAIAMDHYGYHGDEEYGAYTNRKRRK